MEKNPDEASGGASSGAQPGGAPCPQIVTCSQVGVKEKSDGDSTDGHLHHFQVKFSSTDINVYTIDCDQPRTVLEAIKSTENYEEKMKSSDENIVIQLGKEHKNYIIATHFPCSCIKEGESLILSYKSEQVEAVQDQQDKKIQPRDEYSVFYINTTGGTNATKKELFRNKAAVNKFKYLCVYGEKGMTVEEALKRDGRFIDGFCNFHLSDNDDSSHTTKRTEKVDDLDEKKFKICLPWGKAANEEIQPGASKPLDDVVKQKGIGVRAEMKEKDSKVSDEEIYKKLRQQFPSLEKLMESRSPADSSQKAQDRVWMESRFPADSYQRALDRVWMESRFPADSYQKALDLKKENFGKIQRLFNEVHRVRKMITLGESVCKVVVENVCQGTGFVLFDNFILTNAHMLTGCVEDEKLKPDVKVYVFFNYDDPEPDMNNYCFQAHCVTCYSDELDYAMLELNLESRNPSKQTNKKKVGPPPGLLKIFGEAPTTGEACLIGHPAGEVKIIDPTCIIEKEKREQTANDDIPSCKDKRFVVHKINDLEKRGIESIMMGGCKADNVTTYNTFMYHGASGSPVFDEHGNVFGLHTAGFVYGQPFLKESVIEYAQPVLTIFKHFVSKMMDRGNEQSLLKRVEEEAKGNSELEEVFKKRKDLQKEKCTGRELSEEN